MCAMLSKLTLRSDVAFVDLERLALSLTWQSDRQTAGLQDIYKGRPARDWKRWMTFGSPWMDSKSIFQS